MKKRRNNSGFTMAEMLMVVALIVILLAASFIAVQRHQRSLTRLEFDSIAKEIFIAAQNHLTQAESQGYLDESFENGTKWGVVDDKDKKVYFFVVNNGSAGTYDEALNLLLPFGSIDGSIINGGSIIISYQPSTARVLDVFYSQPGTSGMLTLSGTAFTGTEAEYKTLMEGYRDINGSKAGDRQNYNGKVIGWYGGGDALPIGERLETPEIVVHNEEKLWVEVQDTNSSVTAASLQLTIKGETSGIRKAIVLRKDGTEQSSGDARVTYNETDSTNVFFKVILDDITTSGQHFAELKGEDDKVFTPGENVVLEAVAYNNQALSNIAYSGKNTTNSLFAEVQRKTVSGATPNYEYVALIANFRHFENLDDTLSGFKFNESIKKSTSTESNPQYEAIAKAEQLQNLLWQDKTWDKTTSTGSVKPFVQAIRVLNGYADYQEDKLSNAVKIYKVNNDAAATADNNLYPVDITATNYVLAYDGKNHSMSNVVVNHAGPSGIFGTISTANSSVSNLELIDFDITASNGNAGALAGITTSANITNVLAHNTVAYETKKASDITAITGSETADIAKKAAILQDITAPTSYDAGGLIGSATNCTVSKCAAALVVNGGTNAGGLIGSSSGSIVSASYSGGHTYSGKPDYTGANEPTTPRNSKSAYPARYYDASNVAMYNVIANANAGGLIGNVGTATISNSYSTCSASGATAGGFIGNGTGTITITNCYCTGLVKGTTAYGAFAGTTGVTTDATKPNYYFEIVNEIRNADRDNTGAVTKLNSGYTYMAPLPVVGTGDGKNSNIKAIDESASSYNSFSFPSDSGYAWQTAHPYDNTGLGEYYQHKYNLKTVAQLEGASTTVKATDFVATHYGDWPAPEEFIFN